MNQRAKEFKLKLEEHLIESAPGKDIIRSIVRLKKALLKMTSAEASSPEASSSKAISPEAEER